MYGLAVCFCFTYCFDCTVHVVMSWGHCCVPMHMQMQTTENWNNVVSLAVRPYVQRYVEGAEPLASGIVINSFFTSQVLFISCILR